jgi:hypothetical protein
MPPNLEEREILHFYRTFRLPMNMSLINERRQLAEGGPLGRRGRGRRIQRRGLKDKGEVKGLDVLECLDGSDFEGGDYEGEVGLAWGWGCCDCNWKNGKWRVDCVGCEAHVRMACCAVVNRDTRQRCCLVRRSTVERDFFKTACCA